MFWMVVLHKPEPAPDKSSWITRRRFLGSTAFKVSHLRLSGFAAYSLGSEVVMGKASNPPQLFRGFGEVRYSRGKERVRQRLKSEYEPEKNNT